MAPETMAPETTAPETTAPPRREIERLARAMRRSLASLRAAAEALERFPAMASTQRARLLAVVAEETGHLGGHIDRLERLAAAAARENGRRQRTAVPELVTALRRAAERLGLACEAEEAAAAAGSQPAAVEVGLAPLTAAAAGFLAALRREMAVSRCRLRTRTSGGHLLFDLVWSPELGDVARLCDWQGGALEPDGPEPGLRAVARDHDGEAWFNLDRDGETAYVRVLLPLAGEKTGQEE